MNSLTQTIPEIQKAYADEADPTVFKDLLEQEKRGKRRKVLKRWLRGMIKSLERDRFWAQVAKDQESKFQQVKERRLREILSKTPKDKITGIPIIG